MVDRFRHQHPRLYNGRRPRCLTIGSHFRYRRQAIYKMTTMTDKTLANPSKGRTGDRTRGTSDNLVDSLGAEKGQRAK
jgi:hypothetical protein